MLFSDGINIWGWLVALLCGNVSKFSRCLHNPRITATLLGCCDFFVRESWRVGVGVVLVLCFFSFCASNIHLTLAGLVYFSRLWFTLTISLVSGFKSSRSWLVLIEFNCDISTISRLNFFTHFFVRSFSRTSIKLNV